MNCPQTFDIFRVLKMMDHIWGTYTIFQGIIGHKLNTVYQKDIVYNVTIKIKIVISSQHRIGIILYKMSNNVQQ